MMEEAIRNFPKQFAWDPILENGDRLKGFKRFLVVGMGGSAHPGQLIQTADPCVDVIVHRDYGLSQISKDPVEDRLVIACSYSGNTEEPISAFQEAFKKGLPLCAVSVGGKLLELARQFSVPYIQIPNTGIQPRMAAGFIFRAFAKIMGKNDMLEQSSFLALDLDAESLKEEGKNLAQTLNGSIPLIYASRVNTSLAHIWKITLNETGKIPAFYNVFPELNHNEMTGFDLQESTKHLSERFHFIFLRDQNDHPLVQKRMDVTAQFYRQRGLKVEMLELKGKTVFYKIFSSLLLADWTAYYLALHYGVDPEQIPMVEEFKKLISE